MRDKDILNKIKKGIEDSTPNILHKINIKDVVIEDAPVVIKEPKKKRSFSWIPSLSIAFATFIFGFFLGLVILQPGGGTTYSVQTPVSVTEKDRVVADYAVSGLSLITGSNNSQMKLALISKDFVANEDIDKFHNYIGIVEEYLDFNTNKISITQNHKDHYNYEYKMEIEVSNIFNVKTSYLMYYDENREVDGDEEEKEMKGIIIINSKIYNFESEEETETGESEITVVIYEEDPNFKNSRNNRIEIEKEVEDDEYSHQYKIYENGKVVTSVELTSEDGETILEVKEELEDEKYEFRIFEEDLELYNYYITLGDDLEDPGFNLLIDIKNIQYVYTYEDVKIVK